MHFEKHVERLPIIKHTHIIHQEPFKVSLSIDKKKMNVREVLDIYLMNFEVADIVIEDPPIEEVIAGFYGKIS